MHHKKLDKWLQFGGHCDGSFKVLDVSIREFQEESGIDRAPQIYCFDKEKDFCIFDLDIHDLPPDTKRNGPAHKHFDMRFLGIIPEDALINKCNEEVNEIKWFTLEEAQKHIQEESIQRMLKKLKNI
ncbi:nucleoside triphosphate hydrolase [Candidatus Gracilibacteria bacterium]|nr:MAG: nucleoside triphosphate hydrolase [Candidatus Gracilibacteria bacterium]